MSVRLPAINTVGPVRFAVAADHLESLGALTRRVIGLRPLIVVAGRRAYRLAGERALPSLRAAGYEPLLIRVGEGDSHKTLDDARLLWDKLLGLKIDRETALLALGGGGVCDLTGFVGSTLLRGLPVVHAPTTLLAQVDAGLGGKTGVDHRLGKNLIGTFWQPQLSVMDVRTLDTLSGRQIRNGLAEAIKTAFIDGEATWSSLGRRMEQIASCDRRNLYWIVKKCCNIKARVVTVDERETSAIAVPGKKVMQPGRLALNLGHTVGHALQVLPQGRRLLHGEAVALGMRFAARIACELGVCERESARQLEEMLDRAKLPRRFPAVEWSAVADIIAGDKKRRGGPEGRILWILPERIGRVRIHPIPVRELYSERLSAVVENGGKS
ncbi:MAG: 3-dehydroquinate synthase family protein [Candidatus Alcyoniella australis]|nr:3-dehydroquinate synthase family protein [Candidatus Alcyoniella australis]